MDEDEERFKVTIAEEKYRVLPSAIYKAKLLIVSDGVGSKDQPVFIPRFQLLEGQFKDCELNGMINKTSNGRRGKIWEMIRALTGKDLKASDQCNLEGLVGLECYINVEQKGAKNALREYICLDEFRDLERGNRTT